MFLVFLCVILIQFVLTRSAYKKSKKEEEEDEEDREKDLKKDSKIGAKDHLKLFAGNASANAKIMTTQRKKTIQQVQQSTKQLISFGQILASVSVTFDTIPWPITFRTLSFNLKLVNFDVFGMIQGIDTPDACSLTLPFIELFYYHMALLPVIVVACCLVYYLLFPCFKGKVGRDARIDTFWQILNLAMFCLYPGLAQRIFQIFRCTTIQYYPTQIEYMSNDFNVQCYSDEHSQATTIAIVFMVLFVLGIPAFMFTILFTHRHILHNNSHPRFDQVSKRFGSFYRMYEDSYWYWELVETLQKALMTGALVVIAPGTSAQIFVGILLVLFHMLWTLKASPYVRDADDWMQFACSLAILLTVLCGLYLKTLDQPNTETLATSDILLVAVFSVVPLLWIVVCS
jgi:hypothetical protein